MLTPILETDRLLLRRYDEKDIDAFYEIIHDKRLQEFITFPDLSYDEELNYIKKCIEEADIDKCEKWSIVLKDTNETVGNISINKVNKKHNYCEVGYVVRYNYQGNGYASESLKLVTDYLLKKYRLVECLCNSLNTKSIRVIEKCGFKLDASIPNRRINLDGSISALNVYSKEGNSGN